MKRTYTLWITILSFLVCTQAQPIVTFTPQTFSGGPAPVNPVDITGAGDGSGRLFVVEKRGTIRYIINGVISTSYFLDIQNQVMDSGERGLLGMAFHPQYPDSPYVYVNYVVNGTITTRISRFTKNPGNVNDLLENSQLILLTQTGVQSNHKAGDLCFGPDGYLYAGFGDGGGANDPDQNGQNLNTLLGKIVRIDVNSKTPPNNYSIPPDNPFVGVAGLDEIWFYGMRNPWRISFDRNNGNFWIADVGQNAWEEVDFIPAGTAGGKNFGWDCQEGNHAFENNCSGSTVYSWPIFEYPHSCSPCPDGHGASITGGFVYRGSGSPFLQGYYICADYISNYYWLIRQYPNNPANFYVYPKDGTGVINAIVSFGEDDNGELFACNLAGTIYQVESNQTLPINWEDINAVHIEKGNRIEWTLHQAVDVDHFSVQRALTPEFDDLVDVASVIPVADQIHYSYEDHYLQTAGVYYRIAAFMTDGSKEFSPIARILPDPKSKPSLIYDYGLNIWRLSLPDQWQNGNIIICDVQGKQVLSKQLNQDNTVALTPPIIPGCYFVQITAENGTWTDRVVW